MNNENKLLKDEIEKLKEELQSLKAKQKYGLVWEDEEETVPTVIPQLIEERKLKIVNNENKHENLLIEGDNYHSLLALQETHKGKIDVIYIDPPYNTGNEFVYNDKMVDKNDEYKHSKWLSFMNKRLKLAKELLSENGVILVSIDDNEQAQLKLLMDSIFGEKNFVGNVVREESPKKQKIGEVKIKTEHEYMLVYSNKNKNIFKYIEYENANKYVKLVKKLYEKVNNQGIVNDIISRGMKYKSVIIENIEIYVEIIELQTLAKGLRQYKYYDSKKDKLYREADLSSYVGRGLKDFKLTHNGKDIKIPKNGLPSLEKIKDLVKCSINEDNKTIEIIDNVEEIGDNKYSSGKLIFKYGNVVGYKNYLDNNTTPTTLIRGYTGSDARLLQKMGVEFEFPKRVNYIKYILKILKNNNVTVLDFFTGSGTTGHAVMELNKEDGGDRKFILCTNNEVSEEKIRQHFIDKGLLDKNTKTAFKKFYSENETLVNQFYESEEYQNLGIARAVTYERLKRVIEGYVTPKGKSIEGLKDNNLTYLKVEDINEQ